MKILLPEDQLRDGVRRMAGEVNAAYDGRPLTIIGIMTGSIVLLADMIRLLEMPLRVGVVQASSYRDKTTAGSLELNVDLMPDIRRRDVLLVDDIFDTGNTMARLLEVLSAAEPTSIRTSVLLRKQGRQVVDYVPDFIGFEIPDKFVVGYGLDYRDEYRNLPYVAVLEQTEIEAPG